MFNFKTYTYYIILIHRSIQYTILIQKCLYKHILSTPLKTKTSFTVYISTHRAHLYSIHILI